MVFNLVSWAYRWDPYPYIFLNLMVGFVASFSTPIIMMSQNRTEERDRKKFEIDLATNRKAEREIEEIQAKFWKLTKK